MDFGICLKWFLIIEIERKKGKQKYLKFRKLLVKIKKNYKKFLFMKKINLLFSFMLRFYNRVILLFLYIYIKKFDLDFK